jgi:hypothetical protein
MHGVTTAIVAFLFAGVIWPHLIKNKVQFYAGLIIVVFIILLDGIGHTFGVGKVIYGINALLQVTAVVTLVLSAGMTIRDLGGEVINTIDVVRRGGEKETIIVPLRGEKPKPRYPDETPAQARVDLDRDIVAEEAALDAQEGARPIPPAPNPAPSKPPEERGAIPMD